ncbi:MAG: N-acetylmuramoyl-L-alanine amidase-like domain-containing protein [Gemmatimonadota bacterium]
MIRPVPVLVAALVLALSRPCSGTVVPACRLAALPPCRLAAWNKEDWRILESKVRWGVAHGLDTLPVVTAIVRLGATFVGTTYRPATLEVAGPERLVVNLRELDCVTFVENTLALVRFIRRDGTALLADPAAARERYEGYLRELRYRGGKLEGYPSRLHYFSEWLADHERRGFIRQLSRELGGVLDREPITFMSSHASAYRQLGEPGVAAAIGEVEAHLNAGPGRWYIPKNRIAPLVDKIHDGDIIAATSTLAGLDVAHTGFAIWQNGELHLLHAPLVGKSVEISPLSLAERIQGIRTQDGIMVARVEGSDR